MAERSEALRWRALEWVPATWRTNTVLWVETFAILNLSFLALDIYLAHSANSFERPEEYIPLAFSLIAPLLLLFAVLAREWWNRDRWWMLSGHMVGAIAILIGLSGVVYHLDSQFFYERTLRSLTYAAPFAAPLAYAGIGMLLVMNRMVDPRSREWAQWVVLLALGGFIGNFALSLTDHATNGFFSIFEWVPVVSAAFAVAFLIVPMVTTVDIRYLRICAWVLAVQAIVGVAGFALHGMADLHGPSRNLLDNIINGAPPFAPLLFPNLSLLGWIGLWCLAKHVD
jgi:hypothetical protein